jgi:hypothetical protein
LGNSLEAKNSPATVKTIENGRTAALGNPVLSPAESIRKAAVASDETFVDDSASAAFRASSTPWKY